MPHPSLEVNALLTSAEVAAILYVDPKTVTRWALAGKISSVRTPGGHLRFLSSDIQALARVDHTAARTPSPSDGQAAAAVVARAVDVARRAQMTETALAAVTLRRRVEAAAILVAIAAEKARASRATAAAAAAEVVAASAGRAVAALREADLAATALGDAVEQTATAARPAGDDREAVLLAAAVAATARAAAVDVATAVTVAAAAVARAVADLDVEIESRVAQQAVAVQSAAATTASQVAAAMDARATRVADVARQAVIAAGSDGADVNLPTARTPSRPVVDGARSLDLCRELLGATGRLDGPGVGATLDRALAAFGLPRTVDEVLLPSMREVGTRWSHGRCDVDEEQLATDAVRSWLEQRALEAPLPLGEASVVLACGPLDRHTVGLEAFGLLLRHDRFDCHDLGPQIVPTRLTAAARACSARAVVVVSHLTRNRTAAVSALRAVEDDGAALFYAGAAFRTRAARKGLPGQYLGGNLSGAALQVRIQLRGTG